MPVHVQHPLENSGSLARYEPEEENSEQEEQEALSRVKNAPLWKVLKGDKYNAREI